MGTISDFGEYHKIHSAPLESKSAYPIPLKIEDLSGKSVTFIPIASKVEKVTFYVTSGRKALEKLGLIVDQLDISVAGQEEIALTLRKNDFIYVSGGNTFFLLQELNRTKTGQKIIEEVKTGKLYIGESAGAIIMAKHIEYVARMDSIKKAPDLTDYRSLGLIDFYPLPHYECSPFTKSVQSILDTYATNLKLYPFRNHEALLVQDGHTTLLSKES